jgi:hypothetical protein
VRFKNVNSSLNSNIYSYLETPGGQSSNPYLNIVNFFNKRVDYKPVAAQDSCFPALVSNTCYSIHRHLSNIDCLMARTACLVCFISTVNGRSKKKKPWKIGASSRHITNLKQSMLVTFDICGLILQLCLLFGCVADHCGFLATTAMSPLAMFLGKNASDSGTRQSLL